MNDTVLGEFFLVGRTALSLQIGHRISIDLDLFKISSFDENTVLAHLEETYKFQLDYQSKNTLKGRIQDIKVDLISHSYPLVTALIVDEGIRLASLADIAAMKLNSISGNGTRLKDFIDIAYLSSSLTLAQMIDAYFLKYSSRNPVMVVKALEYFTDIDFSEPVDMIGTNYSWKKIKQRLSQMLQKPQKLFNSI